MARKETCPSAAPFVLVACGTALLLLDEFAWDLGRTGVLAAAALNVIGLVTLLVRRQGARR